MNNDVQKLWTDALRSGEYEQSKNYLANVKGGVTAYCCLGVLCDLAVKAGVLKEFRTTQNTLGEPIIEYGGERYDLPKLVVEWAGLDKQNPEVPGGSLAQLNDDGISFHNIALKIEEYL